MPFSSSALTRVASLYWAGGWVNFCSLSIRRNSSASPSRSAGRLLVRRLAVDGEEARPRQHAAGGTQNVAAVLDVHLGHVEQRGQHLRGDETLPDQLVELPLVGLEEILDRLRRQLEGGGPDRLVGVLRPLLRRVAIGSVGKRLRAIRCRDQLARRGQRFLAHPRRIGAHVGDQAHRAAVADLTPLVEALRERHGALHREAEAPGSLLLQPAGDERRAWLLLGLLDRKSVV